MSGAFDPAALHALGTSCDDPLEVTQADELDLLRIGGEEVRTLCATFRLAETIVGVAMATCGQAGDEAMLDVLKVVMERVALLRSTMLTALGMDQADPDFPAAFNATTKTAMGLVRAEWCWQKLLSDRPMPLGVDAMAHVLSTVVQVYPERYALQPGGGFDLAAVRRLMAYACMPSLQGVVNWFDYFQADRTAVVQRLMLAVVEQADHQVKFNPLANWTKADIDAYAAEHDLPAHPLVAQGYPSIGCWPCTRAVRQGETDERAGRWAGQAKTECGLHAS